METIRVLIQNHRLSGGVHGGDMVQMSETRKHLYAMGVETDVSSDPEADLSDYDLVHIFNALETGGSFAYAKNSAAQRVPYVVSSIYWDPMRFLIEGSSFTTLSSIDKIIAHILFRTLSLEKLSSARRQLMAGERAYKYPGLQRARSEILLNAACVLPNSAAEARLLQANYTIPSERIAIVYSAVDPSFAEGNSEVFRTSFGIEGDFVLSCARVEPRKNTLRLIDAAIAEQIPLVILGLAPLSRDTIANKLYRVRSLRRAQARQVAILPSQRYGSPLHRGAYAAARVHALPSWFETPGLASLEAAAAGCQVVTTTEGSASEYFNALAHYCDPGSVTSIRESLRIAWSERYPAENLKRHILSAFSWTKAAQSTLEAYKKAAVRK